MEIQMIKTKGKVQRRVLRSRTVTSRMLGMYRLMDEENIGDGNNIVRNNTIYTRAANQHRKAWGEFKTLVFDELHAHVTSKKAMDEIISRATKETGSLGDLLYSGYHFPKQSISVRTGTVTENAIRRFLESRSIEMRTELISALHVFNGKEIKIDLGNRYDDTIIIAELKYNFNLDTGKISDTVAKLDTANIFLKDRYKNTDLDTAVWFVSLRYPTAGQMSALKTELEAVKDLYIIGYQEFFSAYGLIVTEGMWRRLHKEMEKQIMVAYEGA